MFPEIFLFGRHKKSRNVSLSTGYQVNSMMMQKLSDGLGLEVEEVRGFG
jgi:hypothetical protein